MSEQKKSNKSKRNRKWGRNKLFCEMYRRIGRREKNKAIKLKKHLALYPGDNCARVALEHCE